MQDQGVLSNSRIIHTGFKTYSRSDYNKGNVYLQYTNPAHKLQTLSSTLPETQWGAEIGRPRKWATKEPIAWR